MVKCWYFTPNKDNITVINLEVNLKNIREKLNCSMVETISFDFEGYPDITFTIWMNENGRYEDFDYNEVATKFLNKLNINGFYNEKSITGKYIITCYKYSDELEKEVYLDIPKDLSPKKWIFLANQRLNN